MSWKKLPPVNGSVACNVCGCGARSDLSMDRTIAVGFGDAGYRKDGKLIWSESEQDHKSNSVLDSEEDYHTVQMVEDMAKVDPDHDWRIYFYAPLYEAEYQRQGDGEWILVSKGMGFA